MVLKNILGGRGDDVFILTDDPDSDITNYMIRTGFGDDFVRSGNLADEIRTSKGNDTVYAGGGDDLVMTGNHNDFVDAGHGNDTVYAGAGDDIVKAGKGSDTVYGGTGHDKIYGIKGNNYLDGGVGNDEIHTGRQASTAIGGGGQDRLVADLSKGANHTLTGGSGADTFEFVYQNNKRGADVVITDFELGVDDMIVGGLTAAEWGQAYVDGTADISVTENENGHVVIDIGFGDSVTLEGVTLADMVDFFT